METIRYLIDHTYIGLDIPAILALIGLIAVVVYFIVAHRKRKKIEKQLEEELTATYSGEAAAGAGEASPSEI